MDKRNLRMVVLDGLAETMQVPGAFDLWYDIVGLKIAGYKAFYRDGVLPVSDSDSIATHKIICEEKNGKLIPLLGNSTLTVSRASKSFLTFPAQGLAESCGSQPHIDYVKATMQRCAREGRVLAYDGGFTINPILHGDHETSKLLHEIFGAMKVFFLKHYKIDEVFTAATVRFKVEKTCKYWGYEPVSLFGERLADIPVFRFDNEMVTLMHLKELSAAAIEAAQKYKAMWENRIVIEPSQGVEKKAA